jgi:hypothetical protein
MQVVSLITRDNFFSGYNISIPTDDFMQKLFEFPSFWGYESNAVRGNFTQRYAVK